MRVKRGQKWSLEHGGARIEVTVLSVRGPTVRAVDKTGASLTLRRAAIERERGARLLSAQAPRKKAVPTVTSDEASDKVLKLYEEEHLALARIAERLGIHRSTAQYRLNRARAARAGMGCSSS